jgi:hypothetical protein
MVSAIATATIAPAIGLTGTGTAAHASVSAPPSVGLEPRVSGLLTSIAAREPATLPTYLARHHSEIASALTGPTAARQVGSWWEGLPSTQRNAIERRAPEFLGNLGGIPFAVRGSANQSLLDARLEQTRAKVSAAGDRVSAALKSELDGLRSIRAALRSPEGAPRRILTAFDPTGPMRAAIAIGDVDRADKVSILVPGMFYTVNGQMGDWTRTAQVLYQSQRSWLKRLGQPNTTVATVAWLDYRTPDLMSVLSLKDARAGASALAETIAGIRASRGSDQPYVSVLAHSYGSTAALLAVQESSVTVNALAVLGSPGSLATSTRALNVTRGHVFVGAALLDPIAGIGYFGTDPGSTGYGSRPLGATGGIDPIDGHLMLPAVGHNGYFVPGTESLRNLALIAIGDCALVTT